MICEGCQSLALYSVSLQRVGTTLYVWVFFYFFYKTYALIKVWETIIQYKTRSQIAD